MLFNRRLARLEKKMGHAYSTVEEPMMSRADIDSLMFEALTGDGPDLAKMSKKQLVQYYEGSLKALDTARPGDRQSACDRHLRSELRESYLNDLELLRGDAGPAAVRSS